MQQGYKATNFAYHEIMTTDNYFTGTVASYTLTICGCTTINHFAVSLGKTSKHDVIPILFIETIFGFGF